MYDKRLLYFISGMAFLNFISSIWCINLGGVELRTTKTGNQFWSFLQSCPWSLIIFNFLIKFYLYISHPRLQYSEKDHCLKIFGIGQPDSYMSHSAMEAQGRIPKSHLKQIQNKPLSCVTGKTSFLHDNSDCMVPQMVFLLARLDFDATISTCFVITLLISMSNEILLLWI